MMHIKTNKTPKYLIWFKESKTAEQIKKNHNTEDLITHARPMEIIWHRSGVFFQIVKNNEKWL